MMVQMKLKTKLTDRLKEKLIRKAISQNNKIKHNLMTKVNKLAKFHQYASLCRKSLSAFVVA